MKIVDTRAEPGVCGDFNTFAWLACDLPAGHEGMHSFYFHHPPHRACWQWDYSIDDKHVDNTQRED